MRRTKRIGAAAWSVCIAGVLTMSTQGAIHHVKAGARAGDGTAERPFGAIALAAEALQPGDTCVLHAGVYRETIIPTRSGTAGSPITFRTADGETPVVAGTDPTQGWRKVGDGLYATEIDLDLGPENQVFLDGNMVFEARWPNAGRPAPAGLLEFRTATMKKGTTRTRIVDHQLPALDYTGATVWVSSHKRWYSWTGKVTGHGKGYLDIEDNTDAKGNHICKPKGVYYVFGARPLLDAAGEWFYDREKQTLLLRTPDGKTPDGRVEVKRRRLAFDLRGRSHIELRGLAIHGATIVTDAASASCVIDGCRLSYIHHSSKAEKRYGSQGGSGLVLRGKGHQLRNSEVAYSSGNGVLATGEGFRIINNYIHDANGIGAYCAPLSLSGGAGGHVISHNTITRAGRSCLGTSGFYDTIFQHNDVGWAGYLTHDLGLTYGNGVEGGNSEIRYNWFHDNVCDHICFGVYFDHGCKNLIIHHNVVWNVRDAALYNNQYANYILYYHNTAVGSKRSYRSTWAAAQDKDLYGCYLANNVGDEQTQVNGRDLVMQSNVWSCKDLGEDRLPAPGSKAAETAISIPGVTRDTPGRVPDCGAYEGGVVDWQAGHDFANPPPVVDESRCSAPHRNLLRNTAFMQGRLTSWETSGNEVRVVHDGHNQWETKRETMMGGWSLRFGKAPAELSQRVTGLQPDTAYELMGMVRAPKGSRVVLGMRHADGTEHRSPPAATTAPKWARQKLRFTTGAADSNIVVFVACTDGSAPVHIDDLGLQMKTAP
ncbi:MAG: right-handed parallel beta-helix repeat-containing protein [Victivallales bacterium]|nr:right-handed parallel beta-helix repeat-containing protein [Victivallales bacterium]